MKRFLHLGWSVPCLVSCYSKSRGVQCKNQNYKSEQYDPSENTWSRVSGMQTSRKHSHVLSRYLDVTIRSGKLRIETVGNEILRLPEGAFEDLRSRVNSKFVEFYNPAKDEWRQVKVNWRPRSVHFIAQGKLQAMSLKEPFENHVHNTDENSWRCLHKSSFVPAYFSIMAKTFVQPVPCSGGRLRAFGCSTLLAYGQIYIRVWILFGPEQRVRERDRKHLVAGRTDYLGIRETGF